MEFEQIVKQLEWLDEELRKNKLILNTFEEKTSKIDVLTDQIKELSIKLSKIEPLSAKLEQLEELIGSQRNDFNTANKDFEKKNKQSEKENLKNQEELDRINQSITNIKKEFSNTKDKIKDHSDTEIRMNVTVSELKQKVEVANQNNEKIKQSQKTLEDTRAQDIKRMADMQGEITSIRKRVEEVRQEAETHNEKIQIIDNRFTELISAEAERKKAQVGFLEQQSQAQVAREKIYNEWLEKFETLKKQTEVLETQTQSFDETTRAAKRAQDTYVELNQKLERRINEITEMQRLGEERLRQEWVTFKADDQKRWTGHTLSSDESFRELRKTVEKLEKRTSGMEDAAQTLEDQLHQTTDTTEQQLQELMNIAHQWLTAYERIMGHARKTPK